MAQNALEKKIINGAINAQRKYYDMTGWYLSHAPESFLQVVVAQYIMRLNHAVYIDASISKVKLDLKHKRGRPAKNSRTRADISVWNKSSDTLRAAIEIKRAWSISSVKKDAIKLKQYLKQKRAAKNGYLLVYTDSDADDARGKITADFKEWARQLGWKMCDHRVFAPRDSDWVWGVGLYRFAP